MSARMPPRYLPTLTEVVQPRTPVAAMDAAPDRLPDTAPMATDAAEQADMANLQPGAYAAVPSAPPDRQALAQQLIRLVRPQLEAELRAIAQQHFDAQFSAWLPSLHQQIEAAVRAALDQAQPEQHATRE